MRSIVTFCEVHQILFGIRADQTSPLLKKIETVSEMAWDDLEKYCVRQVGEFRYRPSGWTKACRHVVKREVRLKKDGILNCYYHVLPPTEEGTSRRELLDWHLQHANAENCIKEHKSGFSLEKPPIQIFYANWAYLLIGQLAFNLAAWFKKLVLPSDYHQVKLKSIRHRLLSVAGKIVRTTRQFSLVMSDQYRYQVGGQFALLRLATLNFDQFLSMRSAPIFSSSVSQSVANPLCR